MAFGDHTLIDEQADATGTTEVLVVPAGGVPAGSLIVVVVSARGAVASVNLTCADGASNTYNAILLDSGTNMNGAVFWIAGCAALAENDEITVSGLLDLENRAVRAYWFEGVATSSALQDSSSGQGTSTTYDAGSVDTPDADEYLLLGLLPLARHPEELFTEATDWTTIGSAIGTSFTDNGVDRCVRMAKRVVSAASTYGYAPTGGNTIFTAHNLAFKKAPEGAAIIPESPTCGFSVAAPGLTQTHSLTVVSATQGHTVAAPTVSLVGGDLNVVSATVGHTVTAPRLLLLDDDFEESSANISGSSVSGSDDSATITIKPRVQETEAVSGTTRERWLNPYVRITGASGIRPTFILTDYAATAGDGTYHGAPWQAGRRMVFSYDRDTWTHFDTAHTVGATTITFRHSTAFTQSPVYIAWSPRISVTQFGQRLEDLATAFPTMVLATDSTLDPVPAELSGFPAQAFIVGMYTAQTDELGRTIPETPLYAWWIDDPALMPVGGQKRTMALTMGNHAGEPLGDLNALEGIEYLCSSDTQSDNVRQHFKTLCVGPMNAPVRYGGGWRGSFTQGPGGIDDINRNFTGTTADSGLEIIDKPMQVLLDNLPEFVEVSLDHHGAYSTKFGIYTDTASHDAFLAALDPYVTATVSDKGATPTGDVEQWFATNYGSTFYVTYESGEPTPMTTGERTEWSQAYVKAVSDLLDSGDIPSTIYPQSATVGHTVSAPSLEQESDELPIVSATVGHTVTAPTLTQTTTLIVVSAIRGHEATTASTSTLVGTISIVSCTMGHTVTAPEITTFSLGTTPEERTFHVANENRNLQIAASARELVA